MESVKYFLLPECSQDKEAVFQHKEVGRP